MSQQYIKVADIPACKENVIYSEYPYVQYIEVFNFTTATNILRAHCRRAVRACSWSVQLERAVGERSWSVQLERAVGERSWSVQLERAVGACS